nr:ASCH domain-containing protein [uncultured Rhodoferax sp.]
MKALAVIQPWATLIVHGFKDIENLTWMTRQRGTVLIHASKGMTRYEWERAMQFAAPILISAMEQDATLKHKIDALLGYEDQQRGGIVGMVDIVDCVKSSASPWYMGEVGFVLANARPLPFTPYKGALGFFDVPDAIVKSIDLAL